MGKKSKQLVNDSQNSHGKPHKKSKKSKSSSQKKNSVKSSEDEAKKASSLNRKRTELARVLAVKCAMLSQGSLSYLEYLELRDEIARLNALKDLFANQ